MRLSHVSIPSKSFSSDGGVGLIGFGFKITGGVLLSRLKPMYECVLC